MKKSLRVIVCLLLFLPLASAVDIFFNESGVAYADISVPYSSISDFSFVVTGVLYNDSYPSNITLDIANDGIIDWEYRVYHSNESINLDSVYYAWSDSPQDQTWYFFNVSTASTFMNLLTFGELSSNAFTSLESTNQGTLGLYPAYPNTEEQIITISHSNGTVHAFLPQVGDWLTTPGFYIAKGGSTYYCNSAHINYDNWDGLSECNLTQSHALTPEHLAKEANETLFNFAERVKSPNAVGSINANISGCTPECNITIKVTTDSPGQITLSDFNFTSISPSPPANITLAENETDYLVTIQPYANLTSVGYFYGARPTVYVLALEAENETRSLNANQTARLRQIHENLSRDWDTLTNYSFPLIFRMYTNNTPYKLSDYSVGENFSVYKSSIFNYLMQGISFDEPAILYVLDVWDYFPDESPINYIGEGSDVGIISLIYLNGFTNLSVTTLQNYDSEILMNLALHELTHTFWPYPNNASLFIQRHPACFRQDSTFSCYSESSSPTGEEGYYDLYSVMNPARPYTAKSSLANRNADLSPLDLMLLGLRSPSLEGNFTFYNGTISLQSGEYHAGSLDSLFVIDARTIYSNSKKVHDIVWDIHSESTLIDMGVLQNFSITKDGQNNRSLWVYAKDASNPAHFQLFNIGANSSSQVVSDQTPPVITLIYPIEDFYFDTAPVNITIQADENLSSCSFYPSGILSTSYPLTNLDDQRTAYYTYSFGDGLYNLTLRCIDLEGNINTTTLKTIKVDVYPPVLGLSILGDESETVYTNETDLIINVSISDPFLKNVSFLLWRKNFLNVTSHQSAVTSQSFSGVPLGRYSYNITACDDGFHCATTSSRTVVRYDEGYFILNLDDLNLDDTTDLFVLNRTQLRNISALRFSNSNGIIDFKENVNLSHSGAWDLREHLLMQPLKLMINTSLFPAFNHSAILTFLNVTLVHPILLLDGAPCPSSECSTTYQEANKTFMANVSHFSSYELVEQCSDGLRDGDEAGVDCGGSCSACPLSSPSRGGGGGGGPSGTIMQNQSQTQQNNKSLSNATIDGQGRLTGQIINDNLKNNSSNTLNGSTTKRHLFPTSWNLSFGKFLFYVIFFMLIIGLAAVIFYIRRRSLLRRRIVAIISSQSSAPN